MAEKYAKCILCECRVGLGKLARVVNGVFPIDDALCVCLCGIMRPPSVWENELGMKRVRQPEGADSMGMTGG